MSIQIDDFEIILHGVNGEQYFEGCGTSFTAFDFVSTGIGRSDHEALYDALDQLAFSDYEINDDLEAELEKVDKTDQIDALDAEYQFDGSDEGRASEMHVYVSVRVKSR